MLCLETDSWELVDTEANAYPGDVVEYKVAKAQNGLLTESTWTTGTVYVLPLNTLSRMVIMHWFWFFLEKLHVPPTKLKRITIEQECFIF